MPTGPSLPGEQSKVAWRGFASGDWQGLVDIRDFIQCNFTPYEGDGAFPQGPPERTRDMWSTLQPLPAKEHEEGIFDVPCDPRHPVSGKFPAAMLLSSVCDAGPPARSIGIIRDEHRSLALVLHGWMHLLATARSADSAVDPLLMGSVIRYLKVFALTRHDAHEEHLFKRMRDRTSALNAELGELQREHARDHRRVAALAALVDKLAAAVGEGAVRATRDLEEAVRSYASWVWERLGREGGVILPAAKRHLTDVDWRAIDAAFVKSSRLDYGGDAHGEARRLFSRTVAASRGGS